MTYEAKNERYETMSYKRCGHSGLKLPRLSLGLWHNFGDVDELENSRRLLRYAFDAGITHFDLANNYGPPPGSAERNFGRILAEDFGSYRDELIISSKAGYHMWSGPYGEWGSRKYMLASLDQSLERMGLDYVDIFYSHRYDPETPLEETMGALDTAVRSGKALYAGISNYYDPEVFSRAVGILQELGTPCLIHQPRYSMLDRKVEGQLLATQEKLGVGSIVFSPLEQGILTGRYLDGIPEDSRAGRSDSPFLQPDKVEETMLIVRELNQIARDRGQSLAQMAISWVLRQSAVTSAVIGASRVEQIEDLLPTVDAAEFSDEELQAIDQACGLS
ncbi:L-glyceraldehyde 3-phosphate reductase [Coraliomargarita sinensis]|uniref:L-glyceraldehyde 3-phosphate reductase n=1 Tax=Coraliomargarita sinensis TaxID=2174842 RepID=A0A317ZFH7_9BACT|nr:L-glyceraldehyde 3-phosphate reductase [Coraliomargarita sinensis]PXA04315.1 L-glyceraldehyde 3-phosphate reductase [Coraliomargarita sinensis]